MASRKIFIGVDIGGTKAEIAAVECVMPGRDRLSSVDGGCDSLRSVGGECGSVGSVDEGARVSEESGGAAAKLGRRDDGSIEMPGAYLPAQEWAKAVWTDPAAWLQDLIATYLAQVECDWADVAAVAIGATGIEDKEQAEALADQLHSAHSGVAWQVVNDAELVVPAAGLTSGVGVICGTGSIVVGHDGSGDRLRVGGWGNLLGDEGSGAGLVRESLKATLRRDDAGEPAGVLAGALIGMSEATSIRELAFDLCFRRGPVAWGEYAPAVFKAADAGDKDACAIIDQGGADLAHQVDQIIRRGAVGHDVVLAGSVIIHQSRLRHAFTATLAQQHPDMATRCLEVPPAQGALNLATRTTREDSSSKAPIRTTS